MDIYIVGHYISFLVGVSFRSAVMYSSASRLFAWMCWGNQPHAGFSMRMFHAQILHHALCRIGCCTFAGKPRLSFSLSAFSNFELPLLPLFRSKRIHSSKPCVQYYYLKKKNMTFMSFLCLILIALNRKCINIRKTSRENYSWNFSLIFSGT